MIPQNKLFSKSRMLLTVGAMGVGVLLMPHSLNRAQPWTQQGFRRGQQFKKEDIIIVDGRKEIRQTDHLPWSAVCKVIAKFPNGVTQEGTGSLIGPHHCLTAKHVVYDDDKPASSITIIPGYDGTKKSKSALLPDHAEPFGETRGSYIFALQCDVAVILTDTNIGKKTGSFGFDGSLSDDELKNKLVHLAGYPLDKNNAERMYYDAGKITDVDATTLSYKIGTYSGQSGAGVFKYTPSERLDEEVPQLEIVGVHTDGSKSVNKGTRLFTDLAKRIKKLRQDNFSDYKIEDVKLPTD